MPKKKQEKPVYYISLDPYDFYRSSALTRRKNAVGFERLLYEIFGPETIASLAFYLDGAIKVPKIPRILYESELRERKYFHGPRKYFGTMNGRVRSRSNFRKPFIDDYYSLIDSWESITNSTGTVSAIKQNFGYSDVSAIELLPSFTKDTVYSKRSPLTKKWGGPFEKFHSSYSISPISVSRRVYGTVKFLPSNQESDSTLEREMTINNYCRVTTSDQQNQLDLEKARADLMMGKHATSMIAGLLPDITRFDLVRSIGELKDLKTTKNPVQIIRELRENFRSLKGNADLYLTEQFGILPLISDAKKWLYLPDKISKQVNFLISRSGKPTTLRTKRIIDPIGSVMSFQDIGGIHSDFFKINSSPRFNCEAELRLVANVNFEFPPIVLPGLQDERLRKLWGVDPSLSTVYELMPWSWLIDWFSGLGDYISTIEKFHSSGTIINYGFMTYQSKGTLEMGVTLKSSSNLTYDIRPGSFNSYDSVPSNSGKAKYHYDYQKRVWLHDVDVQSASKPEFITSDFQKSIILALFGQRLL